MKVTHQVLPLGLGDTMWLVAPLLKLILVTPLLKLIQVTHQVLALLLAGALWLLQAPTDFSTHVSQQVS